MSLVAYDASSGEESDNESEDVSSNAREAAPDLSQTKKSRGLSLPPPKANESTNGDHKDAEMTNGSGHISDDEEYFPHLGVTTNRDDTALAGEPDISSIHFEKLPTPKAPASAAIAEEDDEFLHKKAAPTQVEKPPPTRTPVKITIPSLADFKDLDKDGDKKLRLPQGPSLKSCSLLKLLPKPKHEQVFTKAEPEASTKTTKTSTTSLVPDSVKNRQAKATRTLRNPLKPQQKSLAGNISDSEGSCDEEADFFSLNSKDQLPEVSQNEINSMVAKKAAKMAEASSKIEEMLAKPDTEDEASEEEVQVEQQDVRFDEKAMHALVGSSAKRRKVEVNVVELSSEQVLPNKDEWLRTALAQATTYQPKGVLVDEELVPGTRKKHQITYLAHQAKANELELQAMWSANRHTRRQTQSKYGF